MKALKFSLVSILLTLTAAVTAHASATPAEVAHTLYSAFASHDSETMVGLYAESQGPIFSDPIFQNLNSRETKGMWMMLVAGGKDLQLSFQIESSNETHATVSWRAEYTYSATGNKVVNEVLSTLEVRDGKIVQQRDVFDLCAWTWQALGMIQGPVVCRIPSLIRGQARASLEAFLQENKL